MKFSRIVCRIGIICVPSCHDIDATDRMRLFLKSHIDSETRQSIQLGSEWHLSDAYFCKQQGESDMGTLRMDGVWLAPLSPLACRRWSKWFEFDCNASVWFFLSYLTIFSSCSVFASYRLKIWKWKRYCIWSPSRFLSSLEQARMYKILEKSFNCSYLHIDDSYFRFLLSIGWPMTMRSFLVGFGRLWP